LSYEVLISLLTIGGTLLLVVTGLLNFSVFLRQLRAAREQLETARRQLESARQQPEIQLVQRAMDETSDHLRILVQKPYLRPYFYDNKIWAEGDTASIDEVKALAELLLNNFASAIIHSAAFPQYPVRSVEQTIRYHLHNSPALRDFLMEGFERFQLAGLALLCLKNETKEETEKDLLELIAASKNDEQERARRKRLLTHLQSTDKVDALELAKYSLEGASSVAGSGSSQE
jgi:type II secretory pathway pseudopilin PulG